LGPKEAEQKGARLVAYVKVAGLARVEKALMKQTLPSVIRIDDLALRSLPHNLPGNYDHELSKWLIRMLYYLILFLSLKCLAHLDKGANLFPRHVLKENVVFERNHNATFRLLSFGDKIVCGFGLLLVEENGSTAL
jgi:hypothetical protein